MLTLEKLRKMSEEGERKNKENYIKAQSKKEEKKRLYDYKEAKRIIREAEKILVKAAKKGERNYSVFILRRGIHFKSKIDKDNPAKSLEQNMVGKTIYDHFFTTRRLKISFDKKYDDETKGVTGLSDPFDYEMVVSW